MFPLKTIDRLTLRSFLGPLLASFFIIMFVLMMNAVWRYIDELVGKGLSFDVIAQLIFYAIANLIPLGLPLVALFASILTMSNLGENYELLAMKSAGMSLQRIMAPLTIVALLFSVASFFVANNYVPYANRQMYALLYDIRQQKEVMEFKDGAFFNGIDQMSIRVGHQNPETKRLYDVLIYDNRDKSGKMTVTRADSGYIRMSEDKQFLLVSLYDGETYDIGRDREWQKGLMRHHKFKRQEGTMLTSVLATDSINPLLQSPQTKNLDALDHAIDSLERSVIELTTKAYAPMLKDYIFIHDPYRFIAPDSLGSRSPYQVVVDMKDSITQRPLDDQIRIYNDAYRNAMSSSNIVDFNEFSSKEAINSLYRSSIEWHRKLALPISVMIFFLIGAPLGAIIRKGGLGMSVLISVIFFVIYYVIILFGEKMARDGVWPAYIGMWLSTVILFPIAIYLTYKATTDSNLMSGDWYYNQWIKFKEWRAKRFTKKSNKKSTKI